MATDSGPATGFPSSISLHQPLRDGRHPRPVRVGHSGADVERDRGLSRLGQDLCARVPGRMDWGAA